MPAWSRASIYVSNSAFDPRPIVWLLFCPSGHNEYILLLSGCFFYCFWHFQVHKSWSYRLGCTKLHLAACHWPDPLGELTTSPRLLNGWGGNTSKFSPPHWCLQHLDLGVVIALTTGFVLYFPPNVGMYVEQHYTSCVLQATEPHAPCGAGNKP